MNTPTRKSFAVFRSLSDLLQKNQSSKYSGAAGCSLNLYSAKDNTWQICRAWSLRSNLSWEVLHLESHRLCMICAKHLARTDPIRHSRQYPPALPLDMLSLASRTSGRFSCASVWGRRKGQYGEFNPIRKSWPSGPDQRQLALLWKCFRNHGKPWFGRFLCLSATAPHDHWNWCTSCPEKRLIMGGNGCPGITVFRGLHPSHYFPETETKMFLTASKTDSIQKFSKAIS